MTEKTFQKGDHVEWDSSGGHSVGKVVKKLTEPADIRGHKVAASEDNPNISSNRINRAKRRRISRRA